MLRCRSIRSSSSVAFGAAMFAIVLLVQGAQSLRGKCDGTGTMSPSDRDWA